MDKIGTIILVVGLIILLIAIIILINLLVRRNHFKHAVENIQTESEELSKKVKENIASLVNRFYLISQQNESYVDIYNNFNSEMQNIISTYDEELKNRVSNVLELYKQHKKKQTKIALASAKEWYEEYDGKVQILNSSMNEFLNEDDNCRAEAIPYQRRYRNVKDIYNQNKDKLTLMEDSLQIVFSNMEDLFAEFEKYSSGAYYVEARNVLDKINKVLFALEDALNKLPHLCSRISIILPDRIKEIQDEYAILDKEKYPLHHLKVNTTIESVEDSMAQLSNQLAKFNYKNVDAKITELEEKLKSLKENFAKEREAKAYFDLNQKKAMQDEYFIEKNFMSLKKKLPEYRKIYWVQQKYLDYMDELQDGISQLEKMKRELEGNMITSYMQPYSIIVTHLKELQKEIEKMQSLLADYEIYLSSLKSDSEKAYVFLNEKFLLMKELEKDLRDMNLPPESKCKVLKAQIDKCYTHLQNIGHSIKITPINVESINISVSNAEEIAIRVSSEIKDMKMKMVDAEKTIVYANKYRQSFNDVRQALARAEEAFLMGDFVVALDEASSVVLKMEPVTKN